MRSLFPFLAHARSFGISSISQVVPLFDLEPHLRHLLRSPLREFSVLCLPHSYENDLLIRPPIAERVKLTSTQQPAVTNTGCWHRRTVFPPLTHATPRLLRVPPPRFLFFSLADEQGDLPFSYRIKPLIHAEDFHVSQYENSYLRTGSRPRAFVNPLSRVIECSRVGTTATSGNSACFFKVWSVHSTSYAPAQSIP